MTAKKCTKKRDARAKLLCYLYTLLAFITGNVYFYLNFTPLVKLRPQKFLQFRSISQSSNIQCPAFLVKCTHSTHIILVKAVTLSAKNVMGKIDSTMKCQLCLSATTLTGGTGKTIIQSQSFLQTKYSQQSFFANGPIKFRKRDLFVCLFFAFPRPFCFSNTYTGVFGSGELNHHYTYFVKP